MSNDHEKIARRAYELWEAEGRPEGRAEEHWAQAETEAGGLAEQQADWAGPEGDGIGALPGGEDTLGQGSLESGADEPGAERLSGEEEGETEARLQDDGGAGRPGRGIYAGP